MTDFWFWQLAHSDYVEDARVLLNGVTCMVSVPFTEQTTDKNYYKNNIYNMYS